MSHQELSWEIYKEFRRLSTNCEHRIVVVASDRHLARYLRDAYKDVRSIMIFHDTDQVWNYIRGICTNHLVVFVERNVRPLTFEACTWIDLAYDSKIIVFAT